MQILYTHFNFNLKVWFKEVNIIIYYVWYIEWPISLCTKEEKKSLIEVEVYANTELILISHDYKKIKWEKLRERLYTIKYKILTKLNFLIIKPRKIQVTFKHLMIVGNEYPHLIFVYLGSKSSLRQIRDIMCIKFEWLNFPSYE